MEKVKEIVIKIVKWLGIGVVVLSALKEWFEGLIPLLEKLPF